MTPRTRRGRPLKDPNGRRIHKTFKLPQSLVAWIKEQSQTRTHPNGEPMSEADVVILALRSFIDAEASRSKKEITDAQP